MAFSVKRLTSGLGAEVLFFDVSRPCDRETRNNLLLALFDYQLLVFRNQHLSVSEQIAFTETLGDLELPWSATNTHPQDARMQIVSNAGRQGNSKTSSQYWHTDRSFVENPSLITLLHIQQQPPVGGHTEFANMRAGYDSLNASLKVTVEGLFASHSYSFRFLELRKQRLPPDRAAKESMDYHDVIHPLVKVHPVTGIKGLFLSELCLSGICDLAKEESETLLTDLYLHCLQDKFIYRHEWQLGDLLVWDNTALMHRAVDIPQDYPRVLHRTAISRTSLP
jgi:taurine dioxygenase